MFNIHICINTKNIDHSFENDTFVFKKNGIILREFRLPADCKNFLVKGYNICYNVDGLLEYFFNPGPLKKPHYIPEGYSDLKIDYQVNLYCVKDKNGNRAHYIDTSTLTAEDCLNYNATYNIKQEQIPKEGFWILLWQKPNFRLWKNAYETCDFINKMYPQCRLINEAEFMAYDTYGHMNYSSILSVLPEFRIASQPDFLITTQKIQCDNWDVIATKTGDADGYRLFEEGKKIEKSNFSFFKYENLPEESNFHYNRMDYPFDLEYDSSNYIFPVIDEEKQKQKIITRF